MNRRISNKDFEVLLHTSNKDYKVVPINKVQFPKISNDRQYFCIRTIFSSSDVFRELVRLCSERKDCKFSIIMHNCSMAISAKGSFIEYQDLDSSSHTNGYFAVSFYFVPDAISIK